jgi:hypothetical protein
LNVSASSAGESHVFCSQRGSKVFACFAATLLCAVLSIRAQDGLAAAASAAYPVSDPVTGLSTADSLPPDFDGDDPEAVRDALSGHVPAAGGAPSITSRVRGLIAHPLRTLHRGQQTPASSSAAPSETNHTFLFVLPASYGVRYEAKRKLLTVNVSLASPEDPNAILLRQTVKGQSGRKLVIAPEAKAKGYVQTFDTIQFQTDDTTRTNVQGRAFVPNLERSANGDFALVLVCTLEPPYMSEHAEHSDPTDEEPTDITRRVSTLRGIVDGVWLIDRKDGRIVTKQLRLVK